MTLESLKLKLETIPGVLRITKHEDGMASFLFLQSAHRCVEASFGKTGFFIEYWNHPGTGSDDGPVKEDTVSSEAEAVHNIQQWFQG